MDKLFTFENKLHLTMGNQVTGYSALQHEQVISFNFPQQRFQGNSLLLEWSSFSPTHIIIQHLCCHHWKSPPALICTKNILYFFKCLNSMAKVLHSARTESLGEPSVDVSPALSNPKHHHPREGSYPQLTWFSVLVFQRAQCISVL